MNNKPLNGILFFVVFSISFIVGSLVSTAQAQESKKQESKEPTAEARGLEPVFEEANINIVFVEGEDAVSTNFNKQPILNYSCSGSRTLQLDRGLEVQWGSAFYADFVFFVEEGGTYELWYGGTPPGPGDDTLPSYASPFQYSLDQQEARQVFREDVNVVDIYAPSYYWVLVDEVQLESGQHSMSFQVTEKRRYDGKYYFYLDNFFLVRTVQGKRIVGKPIPPVFPAEMERRDLDYPFRELEDYQVLVRDDPKNIGAYLEISLIYTLLGDHLNAIKYLRRASLADPENTTPLLLQAKNYMYKGDVTTGLKLYWDLLEKEPERLNVWLEAGKVAAWTGRHGESIEFFSRGLESFPDNLDLLVNMGLTYLWAAKEEEADALFKHAEKVASDNYEALRDLAYVFKINGYPDRAIEVFRQTTRLFPQYLEPYTQLEDIYYRNDRLDKADEVHQKISRIFKSSGKLIKFLEVFQTKLGLKQQVLDEYIKRLEEEPDNLELRQVLAQTYFWNGMRRKAIEEYLNILANHAFRSLDEMDQEAVRIYRLLNRGYAYLAYFNQLPEFVKEQKNELSSELGRYRSPDKRDERKMKSLLNQSQSVIERYSLLEKSYSSEIGELQDLQSEESEEAVAFQKIIESSQWVWNREAFVEELQDTADRGLFLANYVLAKIFLTERKLLLSKRLLDDLIGMDPVLAPYHYAFVQNLLWQLRPGETASYLEKVRGELESEYSDILTLDELLRTIQADPEGRGIATGDPEPQVVALQGELDGIARASFEQVSRIEEDLQALHVLLQERMVRKFYFLQEETFLIRRELGDFYIGEEDLDAAIRQFEQVLAIDPWDVEAVYRLGRIYERNGDWSAAMNSYKTVYYADPLYENALQLYNNLASEHADTLEISAQSMFDTSYIKVHGEASFENPLSSTLGWSLKYENDTVRIHNPSITGEYPSTYQIHTLALGLPIDLYYLKLKLHPRVGASVWNVLFADDEARAFSGEAPVDGFFSYFRGFPTLAIDAVFGLSDFVFLSGGYSLGIHKDTVAPGKETLVRHRGELGVTVDFSFVDVFPLRDSSSRTYATVNFISDNTIYEILQELHIGLVKSQIPDLSLAVLLTAAFQNSTEPENREYWSPQSVFSADGGLLGSVYFPIGERNAFGMTLRASGGIYMEEAESKVSLSSEGNFELNYGNSAYYLGVSFSSNTEAFGQALDYWSLFLTLGYTARLPHFLE